MVMVIATAAPMLYKTNGVSDAVTMLVLGILAGIGSAYHFVNVKEAAIDANKAEAPK